MAKDEKVESVAARNKLTGKLWVVNKGTAAHARVAKGLTKGEFEPVDVPKAKSAAEFDPSVDRTPEDLAKLTVPQLKAYADEREADLGDATKKAEILDVLNASTEAE